MTTVSAVPETRFVGVISVTIKLWKVILTLLLYFNYRLLFNANRFNVNSFNLENTSIVTPSVNVTLVSQDLSLIIS